MKHLIAGSGALLIGVLAAAPASSQDCPEWGRFQRAPALSDERIDESSGFAASRANPGMLWTHNDSGDSARLFLVDPEDGSTRAIAQLEGIDARDWEDMAIGPCADAESNCVYVADIGDNLAIHDDVVLHRFEEPEIGATTTVRMIDSVESLRFTYEDGARDAEALMVHPSSGRIFVADKNDSGTVQIYEVPARFGETVEAKVVATFEVNETNDFGNLITAGDFAPDGRTAVLKTYFFLYTFCGDSDDPVALFSTEPSMQNAPLTLQGESLAWDARADRIWMTSERLPAPVFFMDRVVAQEPDAGMQVVDAGVPGGPDADAATAPTDAANTPGDAEAPPGSGTHSGAEKEGCSSANARPTSLPFGLLLLSFGMFRRRRDSARRRRNASAPAS